MKKLIALILALAMALSMSACGTSAEPTEAPKQTEAPVQNESEAPATRTFTDSTGREVTVDAEITRIAVSGPLAQQVLFSLAPDKMIGIATEWDSSAEQYLATEYYNLPILGQLYGGKGEMNLEELLSAAPQIVIDVGESKGDVGADMDALQEQTGITFVHVSATLSTMGDAYRMLGELLGMEEEAKQLATYCESTYSRIMEIVGSVEKANLLYVTGEEGLNVIAQSAYHGEVIDLLGNNLAVMEEPSSKGSGNEVDMEQILNWNPDVIIFSDESIFDTVGDDPMWQTVKAISEDKFYEVPAGPYNWLGFPPSVQRLLGMMWMTKLLYPEAADYDLYEEVKTFYDLFYHCELTSEQFDALMANSIGK
ncbi:MAG: ABC transporter substrate-binding protein [Oscillospiraceae bacterium]|nr:ABC transporter substrate-binding protein [Oscillospiraceae bacterium]